VGYPSLIIDGGWLLWRCAFGESSDPDRPAGARFVDHCLRWARFHGVDHVAVAWDGGREGRRAIFPGYKSKPRAADTAAEEIREARIEGKRWLDELFGLLATETYTVDGWEADDVCASYAAREVEAGRKVLVVSGDKDFLQCVSKRSHFLRVPRGREKPTVVWRGTFETVADLPPEPDARSAWLGFQSFRGDPVDCVPGVRGIGEKGAREAIRTYPDALSRLARGLGFPKLSTRTRKALEAPGALEAAILSYKLVELRRDLPLGLPLPNPDVEAARDLLWDSGYPDLAEDRVGPLSLLSLVRG